MKALVYYFVQGIVYHFAHHDGLTFKLVTEPLCGHLNESYREVLSFGIFHFALQGATSF